MNTQMKALNKKAICGYFGAMLISSAAFGWTSTSPTQKEYNFKFQYQGKLLEVKRTAASYEDAFDAAAQYCFQTLKGKGKVSEDKGLDIIDVCANPRT